MKCTEWPSLTFDGNTLPHPLMIYTFLWHKLLGHLRKFTYTVAVFKEFGWRLMADVGTGKKILTHWGRVTHIRVSELTIIGSDNGLWPGRRQAIIWTNAGILLIGPLGIHFGEILIEIRTFSFKRMRFKMASIWSRPTCVKPGLVITLDYWTICKEAAINQVTTLYHN